MASLLETITDRAANSFTLEVNKDNWDKWVDHWIETGEKFHSELLDEGLLKTAAQVRNHIRKVQEDENRQ